MKVLGYIAVAIVLFYVLIVAEDFGDQRTNLNDIKVADISYEALEDAMKSSTDVHWQKIKNTYVGERVIWEGWVVDVSGTGRFLDVAIDMEQPGEGWSIQDVYLGNVPSAQALALRKNQRVRFTGRIKVMYAYGVALNVSLSPAEIVAK